MGYITGNRNQMTFLPSSVEDYISKDDQVRAYDIFVESLNFDKLGIKIEEAKSGANPYHPKAMLKLLIYGYAYGIRSSHKLERAAKHNLSFIWLTGNLQPDYRTIARFRKDNITALKNVLTQCVRMCLKLGLVEGNTLFIDGSKIKANASVKQTMAEEEYKQYLEKVTKNIENILAECERIDSEEENKESLVQLSKELQNQEELASKIKNILTEFENTDKKSINLTDSDSIKNKGDRGTKAYHNGQIVVDEKNGLIVNTDVVSEAFDINQFKEQLEQAQEVTGKPAQTACADAGYFNVKDLKEVLPQTMVVVPSQQQAREEQGQVKPFNQKEFTYDSENDEYICPSGNRLCRIAGKPYGRDNLVSYKAKGKECRQCQHFGICTSSTQGRKLAVLVDKDAKDRLETIYSSFEGQRIYRLRKERAELPFAHIKHNLDVRQFLLRSTQCVKGEFSLLATCFNIVRMITLAGGSIELMAKLQNI